jgi:hypothetical protein
MAVIAVPRSLREKLGEEGTDALVVLLNEAGENNKKSVIEVVEERFERRLSEEIGKLRTDMADLRANLIQWMFLFWIGQIADRYPLCFL